MSEKTGRAARRRVAVVALVGLGIAVGIGAGVARAGEPASAGDAYDRNGFHVGLGGVYAFEDFSYDVGRLGVDEAFTGNFDPGFDDTAGIDVLLGYRFHPRFDVALHYEWLEGSDSTRGDPPLEIDMHLLALDARAFLCTGRWQPYALLGAGALVTNTEIVDHAFDKPFDVAVGPAFRFGAGVDFHATPRWSVGVEGGYLLAIGDVKHADYGTLAFVLRRRL